MNECIFCKIINKEIPSQIVYEDEQVLAFEDITPVAPVHILIIPKKHLSSLWDIKEEDMLVLGEIQKVAIKLAKKLNLEKGFRIVSNCNEEGGQAVFHIHYHLIGGRSLNWPPG